VENPKGRIIRVQNQPSLLLHMQNSKELLGQGLLQQQDLRVQQESRASLATTSRRNSPTNSTSSRGSS
jgi:hypothetical protein